MRSVLHALVIVGVGSTGCTRLNPEFAVERKENAATDGATESASSESAGSASAGTSASSTSGSTGTSGGTSTSTSGASESEPTVSAGSDGSTGSDPTGGNDIPLCPDDTPPTEQSVEVLADAYFVQGLDEDVAAVGDALNYGVTEMHSVYSTETETSVLGLSFGPAMPNNVVAMALDLHVHGPASSGTMYIRAGNVGFGEGARDGALAQTGESSWMFRFSPDELWGELGPPEVASMMLGSARVSALGHDAVEPTKVRIPLDVDATNAFFQAGGGTIVVMTGEVTDQATLYVDARESGHGAVLLYWEC